MALANKLAKLRQLSTREQSLVAVAALVWLPAAWLALRVFGSARMQHFMIQADASDKPALLPEQAERLGYLINLAARHTWPHATCLPRSLVLVWLLRRRGAHGCLRIGVRVTGGTLDAHAWVELDGLPVNDKRDIATRFAPFSTPVPLAAFSSP